MAAELPPPLATHRGLPALYSVLGAYFQLELLEPADSELLERVNGIVSSWLGPYFRSQYGSFLDVPEPYRPTILDYIASLPEQLQDANPVDNFEIDAYTAQLRRQTRTDYHVMVSGAEDGSHASPFNYELFSEMPDEHVHDGRIAAYAYLRVTVPDSWPLADFYQRVLEIMSSLRLRWANAGLNYTGFIPAYSEATYQTLYAHARRHPGHDVPFAVRNMLPFHSFLRSVNWLTLVGPSLQPRLLAPPTKGKLVEVSAMQNGWLLRAGAAPAAGDVNRLDYPLAYMEADRMVRPIRQHDAEELCFVGPWSETDTRDWLRRFERRLG